MQLIIGLVIGLVLFLCSILIYFTGLKHGKALSNGNIPNLNLNPVSAVKKHIETKEEKKQIDLYEEGIKNIMSYTGELQRDGEE